MNYKLAKQLKEADYSQEFKQGTWACKHGLEDLMEKNCRCFGDLLFYAPSLSELIEACNPPMYRLEFDDEGSDGYEAMAGTAEDHYTATGKTPEIAVAKLWLELNKK